MLKDFENEIALYHFNRNLNQNIETIVLFPSYKHTYVSSSAIKELVTYDADISMYVPGDIHKEILAGIKRAIEREKNNSDTASEFFLIKDLV